MHKSLEVLCKDIEKTIQKTIDVNYNTEISEYSIIQNIPNRNANIRLIMLHYPVRTDWVYFTSLVQCDSLESMFSELLKTKQYKDFQILGSFENPTHFPTVMKTILDSFRHIEKISKANDVNVRYGFTTGLHSKHLYLEYNVIGDFDNIEKLVFIIVVNNEPA